MTRLYFLSIAISIFAVTEISWAQCDCSKGPKDWKAYASINPYVFSARLTSKNSDLGHFELLQTFKGDVSKNLLVLETGSDCHQSLSSFEIGKVYFFSTEGFFEDRGEGSRFNPSACIKAIPEEKAASVKKWLSSKEFKKLLQKN